MPRFTNCQGLQIIEHLRPLCFIYLLLLTLLLFIKAGRKPISTWVCRHNSKHTEFSGSQIFLRNIIFSSPSSAQEVKNHNFICKESSFVFDRKGTLEIIILGFGWKLGKFKFSMFCLMRFV